MDNAPLTAARPRITVYIPCRDYGRFLSQAIESVITQSRTDWELIILDDGSTDETAQVAQGYALAHPDRIRLIRNASPLGLPACSNIALESARGDAILRLDADDFLDENALMVLGGYLDAHPQADLVYPNFIYVNEEGETLGVENRKKIGPEAKLLDLPAHGACTLIRKRVLKSIGGYSEETPVQDGYELWLKMLHRFRVANVSTPLFFYRQHPQSLSADPGRILTARQAIKRRLVEQAKGKVNPRVVAVIPAKNSYPHLPNIVLQEVAGRPLIDHTVNEARRSGAFQAIVVTTDDPEVARHAGGFAGVRTLLRPDSLSDPQIHLSQVLFHAVTVMETQWGLHPDILVVLSVHSPLRRAEQIRQAIDTLILYKTDSVVSVYEDYDLHFMHGPHGLTPLNPGMMQKLRLEREALYVDNGAIKACWRDAVLEESCLGRTVGHVVMPWEDSIQIKRPLDAWLAHQLLLRRSEAAVPVSETTGGGA